MTAIHKRVLLISNGHGEDAIGASLVTPLHEVGLEVSAFPLVGVGDAYARKQVSICSPIAQMPSGGFILRRRQSLWADLQQGLLRLTYKQILAMRSIRHEFDWVIAIGDIVPLTFAWLSDRPFSFVGCAKSDYYHRNNYNIFEQFFLKNARAKGIFPRDRLTTDSLIRSGIQATYLGNPMMDNLTPRGIEIPRNGQCIALLPGSRAEADENLMLMLPLCLAIAEKEEKPLTFLAAIADLVTIPDTINQDLGWELDQATLCHSKTGVKIHLLKGAFADILHACDLLIGMAGTATEQAVGLGKPVIAIPGNGPQYNLAFAKLQKKLLGDSLFLCDPSSGQSPQSVAHDLLNHPEKRDRFILNGKERMGEAGASQAIAEYVSDQVKASDISPPSYLIIS